MSWYYFIPSLIVAYGITRRIRADGTKLKELEMYDWFVTAVLSAIWPLGIFFLFALWRDDNG